ncbi:MAG TPA: tetratricopeptide repeat protein [Bryobacteraceae bacterium]|nr:tetratricopeptide repeat protein [Bryobacteraceae bacterium]
MNRSKAGSKAKQSKRPVPPVAVAESRSNPLLWIYGPSLLIALIAAFEVYGPALHGPFLLDDQHLNYTLPYAAYVPLKGWLHQMRPLLMFSYWLNFQAGGYSTFGYHLVNLILHFGSSILIFFAACKVLSWAKLDEMQTRILAIFAAGLFLLHPAQTESVSYIASRSETLSVFFVLAAFAVFLYRRTTALSIPRIAGILLLFAAAGLSKEHTAVLPALFLLTDYYWNFEFQPSVMWRNWKLYVPMAVGIAFASVKILRLLRHNQTAGFQMRGLNWHQYFFTECRVIWDYTRLFFIPVGQNLDPDVDISRNVLAHGAIFALAGLLLVTVLAWIYRRRFPLASYGWFVWLILLAPTSSLVPIRDPMAERRMYLPFIGLIFVTLEILRRWKVSRNGLIAALATVLVVEGALTYQRNLLWSNAVDIWKDTVAKSPEKYRPRFQLAYVEYQAGSCSDAAEQYQKAATLVRPRYDLLLDWALAYDCAGNSQQAIAKFEESAKLRPSAHVYSQIGMEYGKSGQYPEALAALQRAQELNPRFAMTYYYLGNIHKIQGNQAQAVADYQRVLSLDPGNQPARDALARMATQ